jgi:hypothetical protein
MSSARVFKVENRLAKLARLPGGKSIDEALKAAEQKIESVRVRCERSLLHKADALQTAAQGDREAGAAATLDEVYDLANAIFGVAGTFGYDALAEAACSLCDLVHGFRSGDAVNWSAVDVHVDGIRLLATGQKVGAESILAGLQRVKARFVPKT